MTKILTVGEHSYVGESVKDYILSHSSGITVDTVSSRNEAWKKGDFSKYDTVFHVAGIAHVNASKDMKPLYYAVNRDLTLEVASRAKASGVGLFIFMSSQIVYHESKSLKPEVITHHTAERPNGFYGDSKLQAERGLHALENDTFKVCILRPPMIYGPHSKGNFPRLAGLARLTPVFPAWHNRRSMLYIDNLAEFVMQAAERRMSGTYCPQNAELSDTVEIIRYFAAAAGHRIWISRIFNPLVSLASHFLQPVNKMFATYYYSPEMSRADFDYQKVSLKESLRRVAASMQENA